MIDRPKQHPGRERQFYDRFLKKAAAVQTEIQGAKIPEQCRQLRLKNRWQPQNHKNTGNHKAGRLRGVNRPAGLGKWRQSKRNKASPPESMGQACNCLNAAALTAGTAGPACDIASIFLLALCRPGGPCAWAVRRASYSPQIKNATQNPRPMLSGTEIRPPLCGSFGCRHCRPRLLR